MKNGNWSMIFGKSGKMSLSNSKKKLKI